MKNERGRSMLEMLGVLAIVGILSLVGVAGFQKAMVTHRTNQLVEDMRLAGLIVLDEWLDRLTLEEISLEGKFDQQTPYDFTVTLENENADTFVIMADGVAYNICEEVIKKEPQWAEEIIANGEENACHEGSNLIGFFFNNDLGKIADFCTKDEDCGHCSQCVNKRCQYGFKNRSGNCFSCDDSTEQIKDTDKEECNRCPNRMYSSYSGGRCLTCKTHIANYWSNVPYEECMKCSNISKVAPGETGLCWWCDGNIDPATGKCDTIDCNLSDRYAIQGVTLELCNQCTNRFYVDDTCAVCPQASKLYSNTSFEQCLMCPNMASSASPGGFGSCSYCSGTVDLITGKCINFDCDSEESKIYGVTAQECSRCTNRMWSSASGGRCLLSLDRVNVLADGVWWSSVPKEECEKHSNHYSIDDGGVCFYCSGNFDSTTGLCDEADCENNPNYGRIYGADEATCTRCGGTLAMITRSWGKVTVCRRNE